MDTYSIDGMLILPQGRAGLVALRRSGAGGAALGRGYYKGGFEPKMTRREAALILEMPYVGSLAITTPLLIYPDPLQQLN